MHLIRAAEQAHHPFPALMAGVSPGRVPVHTALKRRHAGGHVINLSKRQCQLRNPHSFCTVSTSGTCRCTTTGIVNDSVQHRSCNCGVSTVSSQTAPRSLPDLHNQQQPPCQCTVTGESQWSLKSETMGSCLCAPTGMLTTLKRNCNCGTSTVMRLWIRAFAAHTKGTTTLSKNCTCGMPT